MAQYLLNNDELTPLNVLAVPTTGPWRQHVDTIQSCKVSSGVTCWFMLGYQGETHPLLRRFNECVLLPIIKGPVVLDFDTLPSALDFVSAHRHFYAKPKASENYVWCVSCGKKRAEFGHGRKVQWCVDCRWPGAFAKQT